MIFTSEQIEFLRSEKKNLERIIAAEPKKGILRFVARQESLELLIELHNIAMNKQNAEARAKAAEENKNAS